MWETVVIDAEGEAGRDIILTRCRLANREEQGLGVLLALVGLEGLVLQLGTQCTTQSLILNRLVLVEHAHDARIGERGDTEQFGQHVLRLLVVVDIIKKPNLHNGNSAAKIRTFTRARKDAANQECLV